jgi:hypothetical protein
MWTQHWPKVLSVSDTDACDLGLMKPTYRAVAVMASSAQTPAERAKRRRHRDLLARHRKR